MQLPASHNWIQKHFADVTATSTASNALHLLARDGHAVFQHRSCSRDGECEGLHGEGGTSKWHELSGVVEEQPIHGATDSAVSNCAEENLGNTVND
jgi:hypothetical protein